MSFKYSSARFCEALLPFQLFHFNLCTSIKTNILTSLFDKLNLSKMQKNA
jgi:hypothetical protein